MLVQGEAVESYDGVAGGKLVLEAALEDRWLLLCGSSFGLEVCNPLLLGGELLLQTGDSVDRYCRYVTSIYLASLLLTAAVAASTRASVSMTAAISSHSAAPRPRPVQQSRIKVFQRTEFIIMIAELRSTN